MNTTVTVLVTRLTSCSVYYQLSVYLCSFLPPRHRCLACCGGALSLGYRRYGVRSFIEYRVVRSMERLLLHLDDGKLTDLV
jgi:hypothetical protein